MERALIGEIAVENGPRNSPRGAPEIPGPRAAGTSLFRCVRRKTPIIANTSQTFQLDDHASASINELNNVFNDRVSP